MRKRVKLKRGSAVGKRGEMEGDTKGKGDRQHEKRKVRGKYIREMEREKREMIGSSECGKERKERRKVKERKQ